MRGRGSVKSQVRSTNFGYHEYRRKEEKREEVKLKILYGNHFRFTFSSSHYFLLPLSPPLLLVSAYYYFFHSPFTTCSSDSFIASIFSLSLSSFSRFIALFISSSVSFTCCPQTSLLSFSEFSLSLSQFNFDPTCYYYTLSPSQSASLSFLHRNDPKKERRKEERKKRNPTAVASSFYFSPNFHFLSILLLSLCTIYRIRYRILSMLYLHFIIMIISLKF